MPKIKFRKNNGIITNFVRPGDLIKVTPDKSSGSKCPATFARVLEITGPFFTYSHPLTDFDDIPAPEHYQLVCLYVLPPWNKGERCYFTVVCQNGKIVEFVERLLDPSHMFRSDEHNYQFKILKRKKDIQTVLF